MSSNGVDRYEMTASSIFQAAGTAASGAAEYKPFLPPDNITSDDRDLDRKSCCSSPMPAHPVSRQQHPHQHQHQQQQRRHTQSASREYQQHQDPSTGSSSSSPRTSFSTTASSRHAFGAGVARSTSESSYEDEEEMMTAAASRRHHHKGREGSGRFDPEGESGPRSPSTVSSTGPFVRPRRSSSIPLEPNGWTRGARRSSVAAALAGKDSASRKPARSRSRSRGGQKKDKDFPWRHEQYVTGWKERIWWLLPKTLLAWSTFLLCLALFAAGLTMTLKYILNPDKAALPWRQYCSTDYPTLYSLQDPLRPNQISAHRSHLVVRPLTPDHPSWPYSPHTTIPHSYGPNATLDTLDPVDVFVGVFSMDAGFQRRELIRHSYAAHPKSRTPDTQSVRVRFIMGRPRQRYYKALKAEMEEYGDIVILDIKENMNSGKTHAFFRWAAYNAMVPSWEHRTVDDVERPGGVDQKPIYVGEQPAQYVVKVDDDAFLMLGELERRLRTAPREKAYWGYLVKDRFMGGECYGLSMDLVKYVASHPILRTMTHGKEDVLVSKWLRLHPESQSIVWVTDKCWMYDHPKAGTVYSHGFLYPSEVARVQHEMTTGLDEFTKTVRGGEKHKDAYSTVTRFGLHYRTFDEDMTEEEKVEALVEGSPLSRMRDEGQFESARHASDVPADETLRQRIKRLYDKRPTRKERYRYDPEERGGTVLVHYIKRAEWFEETAIAMLWTKDKSPAWREPRSLGGQTELGWNGMERDEDEGEEGLGRIYGVLMSKDIGL